MQSPETQSPSNSNKVIRTATCTVACILSVFGLFFLGLMLISPFTCDEYLECFMTAGFYTSLPILVILAIYFAILLIAFCVRRCTQKPKVIFVNQSEFDSGNFQQQPATFQPFISSDPQDFVPPSRFYAAARIVMYIYFAVLALIGICFLAWTMYAVLACGFDVGCIVWEAFFVGVALAGPAVTIDTTIFTPLAVFLFLVSKFARKPEVLYIQESEYDQAFGDQGYGPTSVNNKGFVTL